MLLYDGEESNVSKRESKSKKSNLFLKTTTKRMEMINEKSEKNGGLSNITQKNK